MTGKLALVIHPEAATLEAVAESLGAAGLKVMAARSDEEALERLSDFALFVPDVLVTALGANDGSAVLARLRANPLTASLPVVVLASGEAGERRRALHLGLTHLVPPPYDGEELVLNVRLALDQHRDERLLSGSLAQLSVPELLQTAEGARRDGTVVLRSRGRVGTLWLRGGRVIDAEIDDGRRGREAVFAMVVWEEGTFEADFRPVAVPERISESTSFLLLEAMRRRDEARRDAQSPPHAALADPPPPPPRTLLAIHRAVTLLSVTASYAMDHFEEPLLEQRLARARRGLQERHPALLGFDIAPGGRPVLMPRLYDLENAEVASIVEAVAAWVRRFFEEAEDALPGRFALRKLRALTEAIHEDLEDLGFYDALGLNPESGEETP